MTAAIVFAVLSALSNACSAVLQRLAVVDRRPGARPGWRTAIDLVRQPVWLLGALFLIGTFGFQALALYFGPLSVVQPTLVLELVFTLGLRVLVLHDDITSRTWSAAVTICLGLAAFLVDLGSPRDDRRGARPAPPRPSAPPEGAVRCQLCRLTGCWSSPWWR